MKGRKKGNNSFLALTKAIKSVCWVTIIFSVIWILIMSSVTITATMIVSKMSIPELQASETVKEYISFVNGSYTFKDINDIFSTLEDKTDLMIFELIGPIIFETIGFVALIYGLKKLINLINNVSTKKTLFTKDNSQKVATIVEIFSFSLICITNLIMFVLFSFVLYIVRFLFEYATDLMLKQK